MTAISTYSVLSRLDASYIPAVVVDAGRRCDAYCVFTSPGTVHWHHRGDPTRNYRVSCTGGKPVGCTCDGFRHRAKCRHMSGTVTLIESGELTPPADERDAPAGWMRTTEVTEQTMW
jgi:hypothetical protein